MSLTAMWPFSYWTNRGFGFHWCGKACGRNTEDGVGQDGAMQDNREGAGRRMHRE